MYIFFLHIFSLQAQNKLKNELNKVLKLNIGIECLYHSLSSQGMLQAEDMLLIYMYMSDALIINGVGRTLIENLKALSYAISL